ncbi:hypothetical protein H9X78_16225, partial [Clostridium saudiense]|nr:hypothetical protein [Clostridium saudiense]
PTISAKNPNTHTFKILFLYNCPIDNPVLLASLNIAKSIAEIQDGELKVNVYGREFIVDVII